MKAFVRANIQPGIHEQTAKH